MFALYRSGVFKPADPVPVAKPPALVKEAPPPQPGTPIDADTVGAWAKAGFRLESPGSDLDSSLPTFESDYGPNRDITDATLAGLPEVRVPFAMHRGLPRVTDAGLPHLARHKYLTALDLSGSDVTDAGLPQLAGWKNLRSLDLARTKVTAAGMQKHLPEFKHLTTLKLDKSHLTDEVLGTLAENGLLRAVTIRSNPKDKPFVYLDLSYTPVTDEGLKHVAKLTDLTYLNLELTVIRGEGLKHLKPLTKLNSLQVSRRKGQVGDDAYRPLFTDEMLQGLVEAGLLHALNGQGHHPQASGADGKRPTRPEEITGLSFHHTQVTDAELKHLAGLTNLRRLDLQGTRVTGTGFKHLAELKELTYLNLDNCPTTEGGLEAVGGIKNLSELRLTGQPVTAKGVRHLSGLKRLRELYLSSGAVTDEVLEALVHTGVLRALTGRERDRRKHWGVLPLLPLEPALPNSLDDITYLNLIDSRVTDEGLKPLAKLKNLRHLLLGIPDDRRREGIPTVTGTGLKHLTELESLAHLVLDGPHITDECLTHVARLKRLKSLDISYFTAVTRTGLKRLEPLKDTLAELDFRTNPDNSTAEFEAELKTILPKCKLTDLFAGPGTGEER